MKQIRVTKIILVIETVLVFLLVGALGRIGYPPVTLFLLCVLQLMLDVVVFCAVIKPLKNLGETLDMFAGRDWSDGECAVYQTDQRDDGPVCGPEDKRKLGADI